MHLPSTSGRKEIFSPSSDTADLITVGAGFGLYGGKLFFNRRRWIRRYIDSSPSVAAASVLLGSRPTARLLYSAAWQGNPTDVFTARPEAPDLAPWAWPHATYVGFTTAKMAVLLNSKAVGAWVSMGTLARAPLSGGAPREMLEQVQWADWAPDGNSQAVVRDIGGRNRLELPIGKPLYQTGGWIGHPRVSPKGDYIAFADHPLQGDDSGSLAIVDMAGNKEILSAQWFTIQGVAWSPRMERKSGSPTASRARIARCTPPARWQERIVARLPGALCYSTSRKMAESCWSAHLAPRIAGLFAEIRTARTFMARLHVSFRSFRRRQDPAVRRRRRGRRAGLFQTSGLTYAVYIRKTDGSPAVLLGEGGAVSLSPDGKWAIAQSPESPSSI